MTIPMVPSRGGFVRAVGLGLFIRDYLMGKSPFGSPTIDPARGACQADVFFYYKLALFKSYAEDAAVREEEKRAEREKRPISPERIEERTAYYSERIPYKLTSCRYHSFVNYFNMLRRLGWVEEVTEEPSGPEEYDPKFQPRRYYRLTKKGISAPDYEWSNPKLILYPQFSLEYHREKRKQHHYSRRVPTKSHRPARV